MNKIIEDLKNGMLNDKREKLISASSSIVLGLQQDFVPYQPNPTYYEIWFYFPFGFKYIFLGQNNFVVDLSSSTDEVLSTQILKKYELDENEKWNLKRAAEFEFFMSAWQEMEKRLNSQIRCFLIEYGIIRGLDVNTGDLIDGEKINRTL